MATFDSVSEWLNLSIKPSLPMSAGGCGLCQNTRFGIHDETPTMTAQEINANYSTRNGRACTRWSHGVGVERIADFLKPKFPNESALRKMVMCYMKTKYGAFMLGEDPLYKVTLQEPGEDGKPAVCIDCKGNPKKGASNYCFFMGFTLDTGASSSAENQ
jgi:hypothetical protein